MVGAIEGLDRLFLGLGVAVVTEETSSSSSLPKFMPMRTETGLGSSVDAESRGLLATPTNCQLASNKATQLNTVESSILNLSLYFSSFLSWGKSLHENYLKTSEIVEYDEGICASIQNNASISYIFLYRASYFCVKVIK